MATEITRAFRVFILEDLHVQGAYAQVNGLIKGTMGEHTTYQEAADWIGYSGEDNTEYIILEVFHKN